MTDIMRMKKSIPVGASKDKELVVRNYMFCSSKIYSFGVKNNVENVNMQDKNPLRFRKEN